MKYLLVVLALLFFGGAAQAQDALVVATCGTNPQTYTPGATRLLTVDQNGKLCSSSSGGGTGNVSGGPFTSGDIVVGAGGQNVQDVSAVSSALVTGLNSSKVLAYGAGAASSATIDGNWWQNSATGIATDAATTSFHNWTITNDAVDASAVPNGVFTYFFQEACCGSAAKNGRQVGTFSLNLNHAPGDTGQNYTGLQGQVTSSVNLGGATGAGNGLGTIFGGNMRAIISSGATFLHRVDGMEIDTAIGTGASSDLVVGLNIVQAGSQAVAATIADYGIVIANGAAGLSNRDFMMTDGSYDGFPALKTGGTWFSCYPHANNNGTNPCGAIGSFADLSNFSSVSGNIILGPASNGKIDGSFNFFGGLASLTSTTTPTPAAGTLTLTGIATAPTLGANGEGAIYLSATGGLILQGQGSTDDFRIVNKSGATVLNIATGASGVTVSGGAINAARINVTATTVATNGAYLPAANTMAFSTNSLESFRITAAQLIQLTAITTDATHTDSTLCQDTTSHGVYFGSGTLGICLGTSSLRYKHDVADLDVGLSQIMKLEPVSYKLNADHGDPNKVLYGFTAEQGGRVLPKLMTEDNEGRPNTFDYLGIVPVLVKAVQQQQAEIENLKERMR